MTGFGLYETLRVLVPGATAAAVLAFVLRISTGSGPAMSEGPFEALIAGLQGGNFFAASIAAGFLLYLLDLPQKSRLGAEGDPGNGVLMPTTALRQMLHETDADKWISQRSFSLYFFLTDKHLPPEFHRRIYFFGSLFRIYADARFLTATGVAIGVPVGLVATGRGQMPLLNGDSMAFALFCGLVILFIGAAGELRHAGASIQKRQGEKDGRRYLRRLVISVTHMLGVSAAIASLQTIGLLMAGQTGPYVQATGLGLCALALLLWGAAELGPPPKQVKRTEMRYRILARLGVERTADSQLAPIQRTLLDLALFVPSLFGAAAAAQQQGREAVAVLLWMALCCTATLIMSVRKHEIRLINSFKDQVAWLAINVNNINDLRANALRRGSW